MSLRTARIAYLCVLVVLIAGYFFVPVLRSAAIAGVGLVSAGAVVYGSAALRSPRRGAWLTLAIGVVLVSAGNVAFSLTVAPATPMDYPNVPDGLFLAACLPLAVGLLWLGRPGVASRDWAMILDTVALSLALGLVVWITLIRPAVLNLNLTATGKALAIASWVGYIAVLAACGRVVLAWRTNIAMATLSIGVIGFLVSDFLYGISLEHGTGPDAGPIDLGFLAFSAFTGAAALTTSMANVASAAFAHHQLGPYRLVALAVALLVAPSALLVQATEGRMPTGVAIALVSASVGVLMLVRLAMTGRAYRRRAAREHAARLATRALVIATTREEVETGLTEALGRMLPPGVPSRATLVDRDADSPASSLAAGAERLPLTASDDVWVDAGSGKDNVDGLVRSDGRGKLRVALDPVADADTRRVVVFNAPGALLAELTPVLEGLAEQAGSALARIDLMARLRADDRERYFRTLVLTSTDVILISRGGRIEYATPSAWAMFGRDVRGESFDDLLEHEPSEHGDVDADRTAPDGTATEATGPGRSAAGRGAEPESGRAEWRRPRSWSARENGSEGYIRRPDGTTVAVLVHRRDLTDDPTVNGVVTTLRDVTAERDLRRSLAYRASHDALTGLENADLLREQLRGDRERNRAQGSRGRLSAVLFIDLDDFKSVNDSYGHEIGDGLLVTVAHRIQACLRHNDVAARLGGDEFAVLLRDVPDAAAAHAAAQRIADMLGRPANVAGVGVDCQASIGLAIARTPAEFDSLLRRADTALYTAKAQGKGQWRPYDDNMISPVRRRTDLREELETAIRDDKLTLRYQPIVNLATGRAVGFEALIRFDRIKGPPLQPEELIGIAEDNALIISLGDWVLRRALADVRQLNRAGDGPPRYVSVNVSVRQLRQPDFADTVRAHLATAGVDASRLVIEITESLLLAEDERAWGFLAELRREGVRVAIDDYGTGYASLSYLRQSAIDIVKIDRRFLNELSSDRTRLLLDAVLRLTSSLGLVQIAEGVESQYAREVLLTMGCQYGQGYLFAPAMTVAEASDWLWSVTNPGQG